MGLTLACLVKPLPRLTYHFAPPSVCRPPHVTPVPSRAAPRPEVSSAFPLFTMLRSAALRGLSLASRTAQRPSVAPAVRAYHDSVVDHYENPRNVGSLDKNDPNVGTGLVGAPACGDVMKLQIRVNDDGEIVESKFKTFGCGSAIASSSLATEWIKGMNGEFLNADGETAKMALAEY